MAVVDDLGRPSAEAPSEDYGRQPPQDIAAERSVLGGMLLCKDAIADVVEWCGPSDFYRPAHQSSTTPSSTSTAAANRPTR